MGSVENIHHENELDKLSGNNAFLKRIILLVEENLQNEQFGVADLTQAVNMNRYQIYRRLKKLTGKTISQFIREIKLIKALELLKQDEFTVSEIAYRVGFSSPAYFGKCFNEYFGIPPGQARKRMIDVQTTELHGVGEIQVESIDGEKIEHVKKTDKAVNTQFSVKGLLKDYRSKYNRRRLFKYLFVGIFGFGMVLILWQFSWRVMNLGNNDGRNERFDLNKSIAVLPLTDMSPDPDKDQDYLSVGIMNEIIMHLVKIGDLSVTSRTSVMQYKETVKTVPDIARELGVAHVLEGSFWKEENKIRISVQLIDTRNDKNVWAESYERDISDLLAIQSEVAQKVAKALQSKISSKTQRLIESRPTDNEDAYKLYLEATYQYYTWTFEGMDQAEKLFEEALEIDPEFAEVYAYLGNIRSAFHWAMKNPRVSSAEEAVRVALPYYNKALEIDPENVTAHKFLAEMYLYFEWDFEKAQEEYETVLKLEPNYCWNDLLFVTGRFEEADEKTQMQVQLDPLNLEAWIGRIRSLCYRNENEKALEYTEMLVQKDIGSYYVAVSEVYLYLEKYEEAIKMIMNWFNNYPGHRPPRTLSILAIAYYYTGQVEKISSIITELEDRSKISSVGSPSVNLAKFYAQTGKKELTFTWLENAYRTHENDLVEIKFSYIFNALHSDPRWQVMLYNVGFPD